MSQFTVSIIIPNWNGAPLLKMHLPAVVAQDNLLEILVVDDASTDDSVAFLRKKYPTITIIKKDIHEGFASTVNAGVARAQGDIVVLLNTDTQPEKGFLEPLLKNFEDSGVFAVGCMDKSREGDNVTLRGRGVATWRHGYYIHRRGDVDRKITAWVSGGSGAFRRSLWQKLGGMDTLFNPFYWEDIDLSYRALKAGYRLVFEPRSIVRHYHQQGKISQAYSPWYVRMIAYRNQFQFIWKNVTDFDIIGGHMLWTPIELLRSLIRLDLAMVAGYVAAMLRLGQILYRRYLVGKYQKKSDTSILQLLQ